MIDSLHFPNTAAGNIAKGLVYRIGKTAKVGNAISIAQITVSIVKNELYITPNQYKLSVILIWEEVSMLLIEQFKLLTIE